MNDTTNYLGQLKQFRWISIIEAISFLLLLGIAMPLKYIYDIPEAVKYTGWAHGLLFIAYVFQLFYLTVMLKWKFQRLFWYFLAALLPFAPFVVERQLRKEYNF